MRGSGGPDVAHSESRLTSKHSSESSSESSLTPWKEKKERTVAPRYKGSIGMVNRRLGGRWKERDREIEIMGKEGRKEET